MRPVSFTTTLATADDDGVAQLQTPGGAGNLTLNGALVSGGVAILATSGIMRQVLVTTVADESGKTLTIYGTNGSGTAISESMTGPNATTGTTSLYFTTVTRVAVSAAFTGNVKVGTNGVGSSLIVTPDTLVNPFQIGIGCVVTGTINYTVQHSFDDPQTLSAITWFDNTGLSAKTANSDGNYAFAVRAIRTKVNSGTGSVATYIVQSTQTN